MHGIAGEIFDLFARFGSDRYGEDVSLQDHMTQTAQHAEMLGASPSTVAAALLHDVGHFLITARGAPADRSQEPEHEALGAAWLSQAFGEDVTAPIALHVSAKRYLCRVEAGYFDRLSEASRLSLIVQGGVMNEAEAAAFATQPHFDAAVTLRRCDDAGKDVTAPSEPGLERFRSLLSGLAREAA